MAPRAWRRMKDQNYFLYKDVPSSLPSDGSLPTNEEADKQMEYLKEISKASGRKTKTEDLEGKTVDAIVKIWSKLCPKIKIQKRSHIIIKLKRYRNERIKRLKNVGIRKDRKKTQKRQSENPVNKSNFGDLRGKLFDISARDPILKSDLKFYQDQTGDRNLRRVVDADPEDSSYHSQAYDLPSTSAPSSSCPLVQFEDNDSEVESKEEGRGRL